MSQKKTNVALELIMFLHQFVIMNNVLLISWNASNCENQEKEKSDFTHTHEV